MNENYDTYIETTNGLEVVEPQGKTMLLLIIRVCKSSYYLPQKC